MQTMEIRRDIIGVLKEWKDMPGRKPVLLRGARQIGKTWVMETFGKEHFEYHVRFDFDRTPELKSVFRNTKEPERLLRELSLFSDVPIVPGRTLIIFDEIQECEEALNSLKYFCEDAPQYHIIAAGSLLGVAVKRKSMAVPVGKVRTIRMYPLTFREFLAASDPKAFSYVDGLSDIGHLPEVILNRLVLEYRRYSVCGGMPAAALCLLENKGMSAVEEELQGILDLYELDFSKYADPLQISRINALWRSLPSQLSKENRKFIYRIIRTGARAKDYEDALTWLEDAGLIYRIFNVTKPGIPLSAYADLDAFKVYACDCGLLRRLARVPAEAVLDGNAGYTEFKGAMAENLVLQSIVPGLDGGLPYYWNSGNTAEVEFVLQMGTDIIPAEVKAEARISGKSLSEYTRRFSPPYRIRYSFQNLQYNGGLLSCPSPLACWTGKLADMVKRDMQGCE